MSVIIKDMDMPIDCLGCRISCKHESHLAPGRPEDCPLEEAKDGDLISRADAIDAICKVWCYTTYGMCPHDDGYCKGCDEIEAIDALPSADAEQVTSKLKNPCDSLLTGGSDGSKEQKSKLDLISRELAIKRIANDNVVGGMERINEYNNSTEFNDYLGGISDAITTIFCDVPSADITETETCQKCQETTERVLNRQGEEIKRLKASAEAEQTQAEKCEECIHHGTHKDKMTCKECVSAEAVQGWIPVTDRLPEKDELVLVTVWNDISIAWRNIYGGWESAEDMYQKGDVTAWMPLPKPYKGGDTE